MANPYNPQIRKTLNPWPPPVGFRTTHGGPMPAHPARLSYNVAPLLTGAQARSTRARVYEGEGHCSCSTAAPRRQNSRPRRRRPGPNSCGDGGPTSMDGSSAAACLKYRLMLNTTPSSAPNWTCTRFATHPPPGASARKKNGTMHRAHGGRARAWRVACCCTRGMPAQQRVTRRSQGARGQRTFSHFSDTHGSPRTRPM